MNRATETNLEPTPTSYKNIGEFKIYTNINTSQTSITLDSSTMEFPYTIDMYNREHGTNYIGFNSIDIDPSTMPLTKINLIGVTKENVQDYIDFGQFKPVDILTKNTTNNSLQGSLNAISINSNSSANLNLKFLISILLLCEDDYYYYIGLTPVLCSVYTTTFSNNTYGSSNNINFTLYLKNEDTLNKIKSVFYLPGYWFYFKGSSSNQNYKNVDLLNIKYVIDENEKLYNTYLNSTTFQIFESNFDNNQGPSEIKWDINCFCSFNKKRYSIPLLEEDQSTNE